MIDHYHIRVIRVSAGWFAYLDGSAGDGVPVHGGGSTPAKAIERLLQAAQAAPEAFGARVVKVVEVKPVEAVS